MPLRCATAKQAADERGLGERGSWSALQQAADHRALAGRSPEPCDCGRAANCGSRSQVVPKSHDAARSSGLPRGCVGGPSGMDVAKPSRGGKTMTPNKRRLGTTDIEITTAGFGAWAIGGGGWAYGWGPQDDAGSIALIRHAVSRGVNWIDTAAIYGLGHSEEVVGRALREIPASDRPFIFTKGGMIADRERPYDEPTRDLRPESIRREVEASLRRLGVQRIDLYQFHWPDAIGTRVEDSWHEMARLVDEGKVRAAGVSNFDVPLLERAESVGHVDSLQPPFSLVRRD